MSTLQIPSTEKRSGRTKLNQACEMTSVAVVLTIGFAAMATSAPAVAQEKKPNIVMLMMDDVG